MKRKVLHVILFMIVGLFFLSRAFAQSNDAFSYVEKYNQKLDSIKNYKVLFTVKTSIPSLQLPVTRGKMFFKWPAHYSFSTYQHTALPKNKLTPITRFLRRVNFKIVDRGFENVDDRKCKVVELYPLDTAFRQSQYTIWVDASLLLVRRVFELGKDGSEFVYHYTYNKSNNTLPAGLNYTFEFNNHNPQSVPYNPLWNSKTLRTPEHVKGTITINFKYLGIRYEGDQN